MLDAGASERAMGSVTDIDLSQLYDDSNSLNRGWPRSNATQPRSSADAAPDSSQAKSTAGAPDILIPAISNRSGLSAKRVSYADAPQHLTVVQVFGPEHVAS